MERPLRLYQSKRQHPCRKRRLERVSSTARSEKPRNRPAYSRPLFSKAHRTTYMTASALLVNVFPRSAVPPLTTPWTCPVREKGPDSQAALLHAFFGAAKFSPDRGSAPRDAGCTPPGHTGTPGRSGAPPRIAPGRPRRAAPWQCKEPSASRGMLPGRA